MVKSHGFLLGEKVALPGLVDRDQRQVQRERGGGLHAVGQEDLATPQQLGKAGQLGRGLGVQNDLTI